jgi:hypothetical protein
LTAVAVDKTHAPVTEIGKLDQETGRKLSLHVQIPLLGVWILITIEQRFRNTCAEIGERA